MLIRNQFAMEFDLPNPTAMVTLLRLHPELDAVRIGSELLSIEHVLDDTVDYLSNDEYLDAFGNRCSRFLAPAGHLRLRGESLVAMPDGPAEGPAPGFQQPVDQLPTGVLQYLLASRYCEVDQMSLIAGDLFNGTTPGWERAVVIRDWVHDHVRFDYRSARPVKTALDVFTERVGVCRDFQHLAITLCRAMNIPARYATGYLGDIRRPYNGPGDFSAWYEVFLDGRWWTMDARHNDGRLGRVLMATGRDAVDVALTTSFGVANLIHFRVESVEVDEGGKPVPLPAPSPAPAA